MGKSSFAGASADRSGNGSFLATDGLDGHGFGETSKCQAPMKSGKRPLKARNCSLPFLAGGWAGGKTPGMSLLNDELLQAVDLALAGRWDEAHQLVQHYEDNPMASWIHAVLHQQEGDLGNSRYWYRQAGRLDRVGADPHVELAAIRTELLARRG